MSTFRFAWEAFFGVAWTATGVSELAGHGFSDPWIVALGCALYGGQRLLDLIPKEHR